MFVQQDDFELQQLHRNRASALRPLFVYQNMAWRMAMELAERLIVRVRRKRQERDQSTHAML